MVSRTSTGFTWCYEYWLPVSQLVASRFLLWVAMSFPISQPSRVSVRFWNYWSTKRGGDSEQLVWKARALILHHLPHGNHLFSF